jgi:hypothetical protein
VALSWSPWIVLDAEHVQQLAPNAPGLYEVKLDGAVLDYPNGKAAMIYYGSSDTEDATLRAAIERDWMHESKKEIIATWSQYGDLVWRFALEVNAQAEHTRRLDLFVQRFGRPPWGNPEQAKG